MMLFQRHWKRLLVVLCITVFVAIFALSSQPHSGDFTRKFFGSYNHIARKVAHFTEFAVATLLLYAVLRSFVPRLPVTASACVAAAACVAYAFLDELHQAGVPGRTSSLKDVAVDSCGVLSALTLITLFEAGRWLAGKQSAGTAGGACPRCTRGAKGTHGK